MKIEINGAKAVNGKVFAVIEYTYGSVSDKFDLKGRISRDGGLVFFYMDVENDPFDGNYVISCGKRVFLPYELSERIGCMIEEANVVNDNKVTNRIHPLFDKDINRNYHIMGEFLVRDNSDKIPIEFIDKDLLLKEFINLYKEYFDLDCHYEELVCDNLDLNGEIEELKIEIDDLRLE